MKKTTEFGSRRFKGIMEHTGVSVQLTIAICIGIREEGWGGRDKDLGFIKRQLVVETVRADKIIS